MGKHFTDSEKEAIREELLNRGGELFGRFGLKKTTIQDLTDAVGIAKGTFYHFFDSKEILYFEIFLREERLLKQQSVDMLSSMERITPEQFAEFLFKSIGLIDHNPIMQTLLQKDDYEQLMRALPSSYLDDHTEEDTEVLAPLFSKLQQQGILIREDIQSIVGVIRALMMLTLHKPELGEEQFEQTMKLLTQFVADGLIREKDTDHD